MIDLLDSAVAFYDDAKPVSKELFNDSLAMLHDLDQRGYFRFLPELARMLDNLTRHFTPDDARRFATAARSAQS